MARKYKNVQGTNDFLVAAIGLLLLGLWAVKDGWFPSESVKEKHPIMDVAHFEHSGTVEEILAEVGGHISSNSPAVRLQTNMLDAGQEEAEKQLEEVRVELAELERSWLEKSNVDEQELNRLKAEKQKKILELKKRIAGIKQKRMRRMLRPDVNGDVEGIHVEVGQKVEEGDPGISVRADDHFYLFNKSLAIGSLLGALICAIIHLKLR